MALNRPQVIAAAEKLVSRGKIDAAIKEYRKLLSDNPNDASTLNRLGDLYVRIDRIDEAVRLFSQIADRYTEDGFFVKAIAIYKKIIKLDPTRLAVYERLAELYHKQGLITEARTQYQVLVDYYHKHGNPTSAVSVLQRMSALEPDDPAPHVKLADLYQQQKLFDKALVEYRMIAELMVRHNRLEEATQVYKKAIEIAPLDIAFVTDAVLGLKDAGHNAAAARLLAIAIEHNPQAEKIARIAGLSGKPRAEAEPEISSRVLKVSDVTSSGVGEPPGAASPPSPPPASPTVPDVLELDLALLEAPALPAFPGQQEATAPPPPDEIDFILELPEEEGAPSTLVQPTEEMLRRPPESPWFGGGREEQAAELEFELEIEGLSELSVAPPAAPAPPSPPPPTPGVEPAPPSFEPEIDWTFEPEPALELDLEVPPPLPSAPPEPPRPEVSLPALEIDLGELGGEEHGIGDFRIPRLEAEPAVEARTPPPAERIAPESVLETTPPPAPPGSTADRRLKELFAEAEVFARYGLREKALDRLREVLHAEPKHLEGHALMISLLLEEKKFERVAERAAKFARLAVERSRTDVWEQVRQRLLKAGFQIERGRVVPPRTAPGAKKDKISALLDDLAGMAPTRPARAPRPAEAPPPAAAAPPSPPPAAPRPAPAPPPVAPPRPIQGEALDEDELPGIVIPQLPSASQPQPPLGKGAKRPSPPAAAKAAVEADESLSWLDQVIAEPKAAESAASDEKLFEDEEGFFDLAAELEQELSKDDLMAGQDLLGQQEQTLEEIVEGFKKGVAETLSPEDYDTHYNLGIAYREMGLLDEAIGEFQLAAKEPRYLVDCCSLLGASFLEKGLPELAIKWYRRGLESPGLSEDATCGLLYDLGNLYMSTSDMEAARKTFVEIYGINTNYRDVVAKLAELGA